MILFAYVIISTLPFLNSYTGVNYTNDYDLNNFKINILDETFSNQTTWNNLVLNLNQTIDVNNGGNLTIINSFINFSNSNFGFKIENDSFLMIIDSTIMSGGIGINGKTSGTVTVDNVTFDGFSDDIIKLKGNYLTTIKNSNLKNGLSDGIQLESSQFQANLTNIKVENVNKDGIKGEFLKLKADHITISNVGDEGFQMFEAGLEASNIYINNFDGTGIKGENMSSLVQLDNVTITNGIDDAFQITGGKEIIIKNSHFSYSDENGFETDYSGPITITNSIFDHNNIRGIEAINIGSINITNSKIQNNNEFGLFVSNSSNLMISNSEISYNKLGGLFLEKVATGKVKNNSIFSNEKFAINASLNDVAIDASYNYWGTNNASLVLVIGNVNITPIVDENFKSYVLSSSSTQTSDFSILGFFTCLLMVAIYSQKKKNRK
jgi:parallel beta-helix repeat protein